VEADLQRFYRVDLRDLGGSLSWRRLGVLIAGLPREAATVRLMVGEAADWGAAEHLLAAAVDALHAANWQRGARKGSQRPKPIRRPGLDEAGRDVKKIRPRLARTTAEIDALIGLERG